MQKFKFNKNNLPISIRSRLTPIDMQQLPDFIELEGELLEGGTVETHCDKCTGAFTGRAVPDICITCDCHGVEKKDNSWSGSDPVICCNLCDAKLKSGLIHCTNFRCECHNKKEEKGAPWIEPWNRNFNRETPNIKLNTTPGFVPKEEVKLPEMLDINEKITPDPIVYAYKNRMKIVEILTYLASKENEKNH